MNILFFYGTMENGGAERVIASLANMFSLKGDIVKIAVSDDKPSGYKLNDDVDLIHLNTARISGNFFESFTRFCRTIFALRKIIKINTLDIVFAFSPMCAIIAKVASMGLKTKIVGSERSNPYIKNTSRKLRMAVRLCNGIDGFVFQTEGARSFYPKSIQQKGVVIPNGLFAQIPQNIVPLKDRTSCSICATGRLSKVKRYDLLIEAFSQVIESLPDWTLHIYGEGPTRNELESLISSKKLDSKVFLEGRVNDIYSELQKHCIFILSSDNEGMPNGLIEAMACGLACISVNCDFGPSELINDGDNRLLVPRRDVRALSNAILRLANDLDFSCHLASEAEKIRTTHSSVIITERYHSYLKKVLQND